MLKHFGMFLTNHRKTDSSRRLRALLKSHCDLAEEKESAWGLFYPSFFTQPSRFPQRPFITEVNFFSFSRLLLSVIIWSEHSFTKPCRDSPRMNAFTNLGKIFYISVCVCVCFICIYVYIVIIIKNSFMQWHESLLCVQIRFKTVCRIKEQSMA